MVRIFPSLIAADLLNLQKEIESLHEQVDGYHIDIMDNHFVPNLTWGLSFVEAISRITNKQLWIHLMVDNPADWIAKLELPEASIVTIHIESSKSIFEDVQCIKEKKWRSSVAINPNTSLEEVFGIVHAVDQILLMSVNPGFSGQPFESVVLKKIDPLSNHCDRVGTKCSIGMDGGINETNIAQVYDAGVVDVAIASGIFNHKDRVAAINRLRALCYHE